LRNNKSKIELFVYKKNLLKTIIDNMFSDLNNFNDCDTYANRIHIFFFIYFLFNYRLFTFYVVIVSINYILSYYTLFFNKFNTKPTNIFTSEIYYYSMFQIIKNKFIHY